MKVLGIRHVIGLELTAVDEQQLIAGRGQLLDHRPADEASAADYDDLQVVLLLATLGAALPFVSPRGAAFGLRSTIRSIRPHSFACSGVMK